MVRHRVFISYHHANDELYKKEFIRLFGDIFENKSVEPGEYDEDLSTNYIRRLIREEKISMSTVIIVLVGADTYKRKHVDWEIHAGISKAAGGPSGLAGIILPSYDGRQDHIPLRLLDNYRSGYASLYDWSIVQNRYAVQKMIEDTFNNKDTIANRIDISRPLMKINKSD